MKFFIIIAFVEFLFLSCRQDKNDHMCNAISKDYFIVIPITNQKDSCLFITKSFYFYDNSNIDILSGDLFFAKLCQYIKTGSYIVLSDSLYNKFSTDPVREDSEIKDVYQREGIKGLLHNYTKQVPGFPYALYNRELSRRQQRYVMYLLYCNGICTDFSDEDADFYIELKSIEL